MVKGKTPTGRKKVEIKRIDDAEARQVCFTKRRQGLFNKAHELSILCGAMVGVVVFSASGRSYTIGHPSTEDVVNRFLAPTPPIAVPATTDGANQDGSQVTETELRLSEQLTALQGRVDEERKTKESLQEAVKKEMDGRFMQRLNTKIYEFKREELLEFYEELEAMHDAVMGDANLAPDEATGIPRSDLQPSMGVASFSHYQFGESSSQPQPAMDFASSSQYQFGEQGDMHMSLNDPCSSNGFIDGIEVNDPLLGNIYGPDMAP